MTDATGPNPIVLTFGHEELVIRKRYEVLSIVNDILIGVWFVVGSVFFFYESLTTTGTALFVAGSVELLIRPLIRLSRHVHLQKVGAASSVETPHDF
jgi:hypothetical protein